MMPVRSVSVNEKTVFEHKKGDLQGTFTSEGAHLSFEK